MKASNELNNYGPSEFDNSIKRIFKTFFVVFAILLVVIVLLCIFLEKSYTMSVGYVIGSAISALLFYITNKWINETFYSDLLKTSKKLHVIHQLAYIFSMVLLFLFFRTLYVVVGEVIGLLLIKLSIIINKEKV